VDIVISERPEMLAASRIARRLRDGVRRRGTASVALSGGSTAPAMIDALLELDVPWQATTVWQVDERVAPDGEYDRNANQLVALPGRVRLMPVTAVDLRAAAGRYARALPDRIDVVHLGLGADGHTASWPPGDAALLASARAVELVAAFHGRERMTLTRRTVNAARSRVVLVTGAPKRPIVERWLLDDRALPITAVRRTGTHLFLDPAAAPLALGAQ
jgi:6-phosphogluconolactonase/glucosamine-6-phosphate isomerase/deaminase